LQDKLLTAVSKTQRAEGVIEGKAQEKQAVKDERQAEKQAVKDACKYPG
jgi:hypothetical protein